VNLSRIAELTYGFVGADLAALCREAGMKVMQRVLSDNESLDEDSINLKLNEKISVTEQDFMDALKEITPSVLREFSTEKPQDKWCNIGGLHAVKKKLLEAVTLSLSKATVFREIGLKPYNGILVYGPPGCGKTILVRGLVNEVNANYIEIKGAELFSKWVGETEKAIGEIFRKAKALSPCIVFFDEIDALGAARVTGGSLNDKIVNRLIAEIDNTLSHQKIIIIGATNRPDALDPALIRAGRFDLIISIPPPDYTERLEILKIYTDKLNIDASVNLEEIARLTENYVGADLHALCREAAVISLERGGSGKHVAREHFEEALKIIHPSVSKDVIDWYKSFERRFSKVISEYKSHII
jgi:transitional endoplasmic reticulum ATPase